MKCRFSIDIDEEYLKIIIMEYLEKKKEHILKDFKMIDAEEIIRDEIRKILEGQSLIKLSKNYRYYQK